MVRLLFEGGREGGREREGGGGEGEGRGREGREGKKLTTSALVPGSTSCDGGTCGG